MNYACLTDHHNVFGWPSLECEAKKQQKRALFGCELNINKHHLTVIASNQKGIENIIQLNNLAYVSSGRPKVTEKQLMAHNEGLIVLSGCSKGRLQWLMRKKDYQGILKYLAEYKSVFGQNFFLELHNHGQPGTRGIIKGLCLLGKKTRIPLVPTNDCHYLDKEEYQIHKQLVETRTNGKVIPHNRENYFKNETEMSRMFPESLMKTTSLVARKCDASYIHFIGNQKGEEDYPLSMVYYYNDSEAIKKVLFAEKKYKLGQYLFNKMIKEDLVLEDLRQKGELTCVIDAAFGLRGKIMKVEPDPNYYVKSNFHIPLYRASKNKVLSTQFTINDAPSLGLQVHDRRKTIMYT